MANGRVLVWFSCGAASACAAKLTLEQYPDAEVLYCDTLKYEHPDNLRFLRDIENWIDKPVIFLRSEDYSDIFDVFKKTKWLVGNGMARCSIELKAKVRQAYARPDDTHVLGLCSDEAGRIAKFEIDNPELYLKWTLQEMGWSKQTCIAYLNQAGIELPAMYRLGYNNNNCIGCVKGGRGYWNKIRQDFPKAFARMAAQERQMNVSIFPEYFLDEMPRTAGNHKKELSIECSVVCSQARLL